MELRFAFVEAIIIFAYLWAIAAYLTAAYAGIRALRKAYDGPVVRPSCLIIDATRWVFGLRMSDKGWRPRDFISFGVFGAVVACLISAFNIVEFVTTYSWQKLGHVQSLSRVFVDVVTGSTLIILHCGVARRFEKGSS